MEYNYKILIVNFPAIYILTLCLGINDSKALNTFSRDYVMCNDVTLRHVIESAARTAEGRSRANLLIEKSVKCNYRIYSDLYTLRSKILSV